MKGDFATEIRHEKFSEINDVVSKHKWLVQKEPRNSDKLLFFSVLESEIHNLPGFC